MSLRRCPLFLLVFLLTAGCGNEAPTDTEPSANADLIQTEPIRFITSDGFTISGTWFSSNRQQGAWPVVILLHMFGGNHAQWTPYVPELVEGGYLVLAFDLRGHGQSTDRNGSFAPRTLFSRDDLDSMPLDVKAAIDWIETRSEADAQRIGLIGVDIGANIAYISSGTLSGIKTAVSISPDNQQSVLTGEDIPDFQPRSVLFLAAFGDGYAFTSAEAMAEQTQNPKRVKGYQGTAHGFFLLNDADARSEVFKWLKENL